MFGIVFFELFFIYCGKRKCMRPKRVNKIIILRRIVCLVMGKVGLVIISSMSVATNGD
jgi:hypothetical protein